MIHVDDLLCLLRKCTSPLLAALLVLMLLVLKVRMSWHKASLSSQPVWIGWHIDLVTFTVCMESAKQQRLLQLLQLVLDAMHVPRHDVERLTGKLLWLSGLVAFLRSTLAALYAPQHAGQLVMAALTPHDSSSVVVSSASLGCGPERHSFHWPPLCAGWLPLASTCAIACCQPLTFLLGFRNPDASGFKSALNTTHSLCPRLSRGS